MNFQRPFLSALDRIELFRIAALMYGESNNESDSLLIIARIIAYQDFLSLGVTLVRGSSIFAIEVATRLYWMREHPFRHTGFTRVENPHPPLGHMLSTVVRNATNILFNTVILHAPSSQNLVSFLKRLTPGIDLQLAMDMANDNITTIQASSDPIRESPLLTGPTATSSSSSTSVPTTIIRVGARMKNVHRPQPPQLMRQLPKLGNERDPFTFSSSDTDEDVSEPPTPTTSTKASSSKKKTTSRTTTKTTANRTRQITTTSSKHKRVQQKPAEAHPVESVEAQPLEPVEAQPLEPVAHVQPPHFMEGVHLVGDKRARQPTKKFPIESEF